MVQATDTVVLTVPRQVLNDISMLSDGLRDRMHEMLERNTDGLLSETEKQELETLVHMAEFGQIVSLALKPRAGL